MVISKRKTASDPELQHKAETGTNGRSRVKLTTTIGLLVHAAGKQWTLKLNIVPRGGFRGLRANAPLLRDSTPCRPKGSLFVLFWNYQYILILRRGVVVTAALSAPIKPNFLVKIFQKVPKNAFWLVFSKFSPEAKKILPKQGLLCFGRARKINLVELTKKNPRSPPENRRSASDCAPESGEKLMYISKKFDSKGTMGPYELLKLFELKWFNLFSGLFKIN